MRAAPGVCTLLATLLSFGGLAACDKARPVPSRTGASGCTLCHGDASRPEATALLQAAPPATASGRPAGAHGAHLHASPFRSALACTDCHEVPRTYGHANGTVDLVFSPLATANGTLAPWYASGTCSNVYCHGASLNAGGSNVSPQWTGAEPDCASCHGNPPTSHAATQTHCAACHPGTVNADGTINVTGGLHINGVVDQDIIHPAGWADPASHGHAASSDLASCKQCHGSDLLGGTTGVSCDACHATAGHAGWRTECNFCHGDRLQAATSASPLHAAPPLGTQGETLTGDRAVGAHQAHLTGTTYAAAPLACTECHAVPADLGHLDGTPAVTFGAGARRGGAQPVWTNRSSCTASYCHGGTLSAGGSKLAPSWTGGPAEAACGGCHGVPPPGTTHAGVTATTNCGNCHASYDCTSGNLAACTVNKATHMNGSLDVASLSCTSCHGSAANSAPPVDTAGLTSGGVRIGAHQKHLTGTTYLQTPVACAACHAGVASYTTSHPNGTRDVGFSGNVTPTLRTGSWTASAGSTPGSCASTWCHGAVINPVGNGASGGTLTTPTWTGTVAGCTSCHAIAMSSLTNMHTRKHTGYACSVCHGTGYSSTTVNKATHLDGTRTIFTTATGTGIRSYSNGSCAPSCHGSENWYQ